MLVTQWHSINYNQASVNYSRNTTLPGIAAMIKLKEMSCLLHSESADPTDRYSDEVHRVAQFGIDLPDVLFVHDLVVQGVVGQLVGVHHASGRLYRTLEPVVRVALLVGQVLNVLFAQLRRVYHH